MRISHQTHTVDILFPFAVLFTFAVSSLLVLLLSAHIYSEQTTQAQENYYTHTPLSYISEKVRQHDTKDSIAIETLDGLDCLALHTASGDVTYTTYLYVYDGWLKELYAKDGASFSPAAGKNVIEASDFTIINLDEHLYRISITDSSGTITTRILSERSRL